MIDSHVHIMPDLVQNLTDRIQSGPLAMVAPYLPTERLKEARKSARHWLRPFSSSLHRAQTLLRHLPPPAQQGLDELGCCFPVAGLLAESSASDLAEEMEEASVDFALVIPHPPFASNELVLEACAQNPKLIPAARIPKDEKDPVAAFEKYASLGARALKLHPASDGLPVETSSYQDLIEAATGRGLPIIIHTGIIHSHILFKNPSLGEASAFETWFEDFPKARFILAHMNYHEPSTAMDLAETYENVHLETSWQPPEVIADAVRRIGAERVLFGSDWPIVGHNMVLGVNRVRECVKTGLLDERDAQKVLHENAARLLRINAEVL